MIDKNFQLFILRTVASTYPQRVPTKLPALLEAAGEGTMQERIARLLVNLHALQEFGYVIGATEVSDEEEVRLRDYFRITAAGLVMAGLDPLHPDTCHDPR